MNTILPLTDDAVDDHVATIFKTAKANMGRVPNLFRVMAHAPAVLEVYTQTHASLGHGVLPRALREQIAIAVATANHCDYCLAAHTLAGKAAGLTAADLTAAQDGMASDPKSRAVLTLARLINATHGHAHPEAVASARAAGLSDAEILETVAHVSISVLTNSINNIVDTPLDFPPAVRSDVG